MAGNHGGSNLRDVVDKVNSAEEPLKINIDEALRINISLC